MKARLPVTLSAVAIAAALYLGGRAWLAETAPVRARGNDASTSTRVSEARVSPAVAPTSPVEIRENAAAQASSSFVRMELRKVFPDVPAAVADWREFRPERLQVEPLRGMPITFSRTALKDDGRCVTWIGRNAAVPGASLVSVARADGFDAVLVIPGASQFSFHARGNSVVVEESAPGEEGCGVEPAQPDRPTPPARSGVIYRASQASEAAIAEVAEAVNAVSTAPNVDVLFLYDTDSLGYASDRSTDPVGYLEGRSRATLESANLVLAQSGVTSFVWRWAGLEASRPYTRTGVLIDDLRQISPGGAIGDFVADLRYRYGADQVMLFIGGKTDAGGWANITTKQVPVSGSLACTVIRVSSSYKLMAHELAHNFGCRHDRANFGGTGVPTPEGDGFWCYGLLWSDPESVGGNTTSGTVMSYANYIVPYFSNPNITLEVTTAMEERSGPNLPLGTRTIGYPESHAKAAYNARVLNDNASSIVNVNAELTQPRIVVQPQGASVAAGRSLTLSVSAEGGGLLYQWSRNGAVIAGATAASLTRSSVAASDAGDYTVSVSNRIGSVVSSTASVSVTASEPTPAPGGGSSGGGGGGGGAASGAFGALAALLLGLRAARAKR